MLRYTLLVSCDLKVLVSINVTQRSGWTVCSHDACVRFCDWVMETLKSPADGKFPNTLADFVGVEYNSKMSKEVRSKAWALYSVEKTWHQMSYFNFVFLLWAVRWILCWFKNRRSDETKQLVGCFLTVGRLSAEGRHPQNMMVFLVFVF